MLHLTVHGLRSAVAITKFHQHKCSNLVHKSSLKESTLQPSIAKRRFVVCTYDLPLQKPKMYVQLPSSCVRMSSATRKPPAAPGHSSRITRQHTSNERQHTLQWVVQKAEWAALSLLSVCLMPNRALLACRATRCQGWSTVS